MEESTSSHNPDDTVTILDPLVEQMNSIRISSRPVAAREDSQRARRFSDAGGAPFIPLNASTTTRMPLAVRSHDGSRWLPAPDEQSHQYGSPASPGPETTATADAEALAHVESHSCNAAVCAVMKVLQTTELLEMILGMLETKDIWTHRRTSPLWNATIAASPELRLHHFYYPQFTRPASTFRLLPLSMPGLVLELGEPIRLGQWISITMTREAARRISPEAKPSRRVRSRSIFEGLRGGLGSKQGEASDSWPAPAPKADKPATAGNSTLQCSDLYVTQPPILGMQAFIVDPVPDNWDDDAPSKRLPAVAKLSCDAGITLDFLAETAESLLIAKKLEEIGASVMFKAIMSFSKPEPVPRKRGVARGVTRIG